MASTFNIDSRVRKCAIDWQDTVLLAKLSAGDLISQEAVYHDRCLVSLYNRASRQTGSETTNASNKRLEGIALAELTSFMEETRANSEVKPVFKLADLGRLYKSRLENLGAPVSDRVHSTELKNRILANLSDVQAQKPSRDVLLAFKADVSIALQQVCMPDYDDEAMILSRAAKIIRRDIFNAPSSGYNGNFDQQCQQDSIPVSLATLVAMILFQPDIESRSNPYEAQATLSISQLIKYNCSARRRKGKTGIHHNVDRESPLPLYLGLLLHAKTRKRQLVDKLHDLGLSISYDRVLGLSSQMADRIFEMTRSKRGKGVRRRVDPETRLPTNWQAFLRIDSNKAELFSYLAEKLLTVHEYQDKQIVTTKGLAALSNTLRDTSDLFP